MAYELIYNPMIDYIRSHVHLCAVLLYSSKASSLCYTVNMQWGGIVWHACKPNLYVYLRIYMMESKEALPSSNASYVLNVKCMVSAIVIQSLCWTLSML